METARADWWSVNGPRGLVFLTFVFLRPAEAAGRFLELVAVNFDHPEWTKHLCQVGRLITGQNKNTGSRRTLRETLLLLLLFTKVIERKNQTSFFDSYVGGIFEMCLFLKKILLLCFFPHIDSNHYFPHRQTDAVLLWVQTRRNATVQTQITLYVPGKEHKQTHLM